jgi:hypothetical protein
MSIGYMNEMYIAKTIFPPVLVNSRSDIIPKYDQSYWFRDEAAELAPMQAPPVTGYEVDLTDTYFCRKYGLAHAIPDESRANTDAPFDVDVDGTYFLVDRMDAKYERSFVTDFWKAGVWGTDWTGGSTFTKWSDYTDGTPIVDIREAKRTIRRKIARNPNNLVLGDLTWDVLADAPDMLERIKYGSSNATPAIVTPNLVAQLLELESIKIGTSIYTASPEGTAEASVTYSADWDDDALLLYQPPRPSLRTPAAGYTFVWKTVFGTQRYIRRRREPLAEMGDLLEIIEFWDMKVTAANAGLFMADAVD